AGAGRVSAGPINSIARNGTFVLAFAAAPFHTVKRPLIALPRLGISRLTAARSLTIDSRFAGRVVAGMSDVTRILEQIQQGDPLAKPGQNAGRPRMPKCQLANWVSMVNRGQVAKATWPSNYLRKAWSACLLRPPNSSMATFSTRRRGD